MIPLSGSPAPPGDDEKDPSFWTRERRQQLAFDGLILVLKVLQTLFGGGGNG
ncbi:hypothetical protein ACFVJW_06410 [Streptomyces libani]|uniref:hypothetical protein n=1 Tax=Streptomyces nigrescens TaxID=1920 RepID=UPI0036290AF8